LTGVRELAAQIFEKNVRLGQPLKLVGLADIAGGPAFSTCAGLLTYAASSPAEALMTEPEIESSPAIRDGQIGKIGQWLRINF
jgi:cell division protein FtsA